MNIFNSIIVAVLAVATGCAFTQDKALCEKRDWYELGRRDGAQGQALEKMDDYVNECGRGLAERNRSVYTNGRNAGLVEYCQPENAFELGRTGIPYWHVCPSTMEPRFLEAYERGRKSRDLEASIRKLDQQIAILADQRNHSPRGFDRERIEKELHLLKRLRAQNSSQLSKSTN